MTDEDRLIGVSSMSLGPPLAGVDCSLQQQFHGVAPVT